MTTEFNDELLSAVLDGEADPDTVAAVRADSVASARLLQMEQAARLVATPVPDATPQRRASSIAAALAAAPAAPEVTSLSVARERKVERTSRLRNVNWMAVAAACAVVLLSAAVIRGISTSGSDSDTADVATEAVEGVSDESLLGVDESRTSASGVTSADALAESDDGDAMEMAQATQDAMEEDAVEEEAMDEAMEESMSEDAMEQDDGAIPTTTTSLSPDNATVAVNSADAIREQVDAIREQIAAGTIGPYLVVTDFELLDAVAPPCLDPYQDDLTEAFALVELDEIAGPPRVIVVYFGGEEPAVFDAQDCTPVG